MSFERKDVHAVKALDSELEVFALISRSVTHLVYILKDIGPVIHDLIGASVPCI